MIAVGLAAIPGLVKSAVAADDQVIGIVGVDPERVVIDVLPALAQRPERLAAVFGDMQQRIHRIDAVEDAGGRRRSSGSTAGWSRCSSTAWPRSRRRSRSGRSRSRPARPRPWHRATSGLTGETARPIRPLSPSGSPLLIFLQRLAGVGRPVEARLRPAVDQRPDMPPPLIGRGVEHVGVARIEDDIGHAGVLADRQARPSRSCRRRWSCTAPDRRPAFQSGPCAAT